MEKSQQTLHTWLTVLKAVGVGIAVLTMVILAGLKRWIEGRLGAEPAVVIEIVQAVAEGQLAQPRLVQPQRAGSVMQALAAIYGRSAGCYGAAGASKCR